MVVEEQQVEEQQMEAGRTRTRDIFLATVARPVQGILARDVILHWHLGERERSSNQSLLDAFFGTMRYGSRYERALLSDLALV